MVNTDDLICYHCDSKIRLGTKQDAGYVIMKDQTYDLLLSCGIGNDISFEKSFKELYPDIKTYLFDFSENAHDYYKSQNQLLSNTEYVKKKIYSNNSKTDTNLSEYVSDYHDIFLKMDIEGGEFYWNDSLNENFLSKFKQIVIEIHLFFKINSICKSLDQKWDLISKLSKTHYLIHIHANNVKGVRNINNVNIPEVFECTYVRRDVFKKPLLRNAQRLPCDLDYPNVCDKKDIDLNYHPFVSR